MVGFLLLEKLEDGTYMESQFKDGEPIGKMLIVKPNGVYFEGSIQDNEQFRGFFRNPVIKRQSRLDKDPDCSKRICYGVNEEGYVFLNNGQRYKGMIADSRIELTQTNQALSDWRTVPRPKAT